MPNRLTVPVFIKKAIEVHGYYYDYSKIKYVYATTKVTIVCPKHGEFEQSPQKHLSGQGCKKCSFERSASRCRHTTEVFINHAQSIHGTRYDYSQVDYKNNHTKVTIICPDHGPFMQTPGNHTHRANPQGCPTCGGRSVWTKERFIEESRQVHGDRYDYCKVDFTDSVTQVTIICPTHGEFLQDAQHHIRRRQGCPKCGGTAKKSTEEFVERARKIHGDKYNYEETVYISTHKKVCIICPNHGRFWIEPANHNHKTNPQGCSKCSGRISWDKAQFISESQMIHGNLYDYSQIKWNGLKEEVLILCPYHGEFLQKPIVHLMGCGCQKCKSPKGETIIREFLTRKQLTFNEQVRFSDCKDKQLLPFDFVLSLHNGEQLIIEYQGSQHYQPVSFRGKKASEDELLDEFETIKRHDSIKREWCHGKGIPLLEIPHTYSEEQICKAIDRILDSE